MFSPLIPDSFPEGSCRQALCVSVSECVGVNCRCAQRGQSGLAVPARCAPIGSLCLPSSPPPSLCSGGWNLAGFGCLSLLSMIHEAWTGFHKHAVSLALASGQAYSRRKLVYRRCDSNAHIISISKSEHIRERNRLLPTLRILDNLCRSGCVGHERSPSQIMQSILIKGFRNVFMREEMYTEFHFLH